MKRAIIFAILYLAALTAPAHAATIYKCLSAPSKSIAYMTDRSSACAIFILSYEAGTKEPTKADRYFPYQCFSKNGTGPAYWSDSNVGQNCNSIPRPAGTATVITPVKTITATTTTSSTATTSTTSSASTASPSTTSSTTAAGRVFSPDSFWYKPIPANVPLHANSAGFSKDFVRQYKLFYNNVTINTTSYASPVYRVGKGIQPVTVGFNNCQGKPWTDQKFMSMVSAVPIPAYAIQSSASDGEISIYQASTDTLWELWVAKKDASSKWWACWGGRLDNVSKSQGQMPQGYGTTATGLPFIGGQITADELKAGKIEHVMGISLVEIAAAHIYSWPANRSDGYNPGSAANRIPEGLRFRLDPSVNVDALPMTKAGKIIAKAAQTYGFVVWDKAGSISLRAENPLGYKAEGKTDPYPALFEYKAAYDVLKGFPWDKLQFLPHDYGKP